MTPPGNPEFQTPLLGMLALMAASSSSSCLWLLPLPSAPGFCLQAPGALYGWAWQLPNPQTLLHIPPTPSPTPTNTTPMLQALTGTVVGRAQRAIPTTRHPLPQSPDLPAWWVGGCTAWGYLDALKHSGVYYIIGELRYSVIDSSNHKVIPAPLMSIYLPCLWGVCSVRSHWNNLPSSAPRLPTLPPTHPRHNIPHTDIPDPGRHGAASFIPPCVQAQSCPGWMGGYLVRKTDRAASTAICIAKAVRYQGRLGLGVGRWERMIAPALHEVFAFIVCRPGGLASLHCHRGAGNTLK